MGGTLTPAAILDALMQGTGRRPLKLDGVLGEGLEAGSDTTPARLLALAVQAQLHALPAAPDVFDESAATRDERPIVPEDLRPLIVKLVTGKGDPYQEQIESTCAAIAARAGLAEGDWAICYQSRVGPLKWIGPSTDAEIRRAGADKRAIVLYPLAFVSEHSETLVELDIDYRRLAKEVGVPGYTRVPTVGTHPSFIAGLANRVRAVLSTPQVAVCHGATTMPCGQQHRGCPLVAGAA